MNSPCQNCPQAAMYDAARELLDKYRDKHETPDESEALIDFNLAAFRAVSSRLDCPGPEVDKDSDMACPIAQTAINAQTQALVRPHMTAYAVKLSELVSTDDKSREHGQYL